MGFVYSARHSAWILLALFCLAPTGARAIPIGDLVISEILFDPPGGNNGGQWIELYNRGSTPVSLASFQLVWGRDALDQGPVDLDDLVTLAVGQTFVIGGPGSFPGNGSPTYQQLENFAPNLRNGRSGSNADAVALLDGGALVHLVVYGRPSASTTLANEQGGAATVQVQSSDFSGQSIQWQGGDSWAASASEEPGIAPVPEPATALLLAIGLAGLARSSVRATPRRV